MKSPFPLPCAFLHLRSFDLHFYLGGGRVIIIHFLFSPVSFLSVSLIPFSCLFCRCVGLGYAAGHIFHQSSNMPAESGKRFKPSKYVPVSAAAIFLVGATTLFFAFTCPGLSLNVSPAVPIYNAIMFLFVLANFSMATFMDPGIFPRGKIFLYSHVSSLLSLKIIIWADNN